MGNFHSMTLRSNLVETNLSIKDAIIQHLNDHSANLVFLLWGRDAQNRGARIDKVKTIAICQKFSMAHLSIQTRHHVLTAAHPSPLSASNGFLDCKVHSTSNCISIYLFFLALLQNQCLSSIGWSFRNRLVSITIRLNFDSTILFVPKNKVLFVYHLYLFHSLPPFISNQFIILFS